MKVINFIEQFKTITLASSDIDSNPNSSYAPFVFNKNRFYIATSHLAKHTENILTNPKISIMFIEDESKSENIFARERLTINSEAYKIKRDTDEFSEIIELFKLKFKDKANIYLELKDFEMFKIKPIDGRFILGFGKAYFIDKDLNIVNYITGKHQN